MAQRKIDDSLTGAGKVLVMARQKKKNYDNLLGKSQQVCRANPCQQLARGRSDLWIRLCTR